MDNDYTDITIVLDRSGSMQTIKSDMEGAVKHFLDEQKKIPGKCTASLVRFDNEYEEAFLHLPLSDVGEIRLEPRGSTALLDAIGKTVGNLGRYFEGLPENDRPGKVIVVIITDGFENASKEYSRAQIASMTKEQKEKYNWQFVYLGANQDAIAVGQGLGLARGSSFTYDASQKGVQDMSYAVASAAGSYRTGQTKDMLFDDKDRK